MFALGLSGELIIGILWNHLKTVWICGPSIVIDGLFIRKIFLVFIICRSFRKYIKSISAGNLVRNIKLSSWCWCPKRLKHLQLNSKWEFHTKVRVCLLFVLAKIRIILFDHIQKVWIDHLIKNNFLQFVSKL